MKEGVKLSLSCEQGTYKASITFEAERIKKFAVLP